MTFIATVGKIFKCSLDYGFKNGKIVIFVIVGSYSSLVNGNSVFFNACFVCNFTVCVFFLLLAFLVNFFRRMSVVSWYIDRL